MLGECLYLNIRNIFSNFHHAEVGNPFSRYVHTVADRKGRKKVSLRMRNLRENYLLPPTFRKVKKSSYTLARMMDTMREIPLIKTVPFVSQVWGKFRRVLRGLYFCVARMPLCSTSLTLHLPTIYVLKFEGSSPRRVNYNS